MRWAGRRTTRGAVAARAGRPLGVEERGGSRHRPSSRCGTGGSGGPALPPTRPLGRSPLRTRRPAPEERGCSDGRTPAVARYACHVQSWTSATEMLPDPLRRAARAARTRTVRGTGHAPPAGLRRTGTRVPSPTPPQHTVQRRRHQCWVWSTGRSRPTAVPWERPRSLRARCRGTASCPRRRSRPASPSRASAGPACPPGSRPAPALQAFRVRRRPGGRPSPGHRPADERPALSVRGERRLRSPGSSSARRPPNGAPTGPRPRGAACLPRAGTTALRRSGHDGVRRSEPALPAAQARTAQDGNRTTPRPASRGPRSSGDRQRAGSRGPHAGPAVAVPQPPEPDLAAAGGADTARAPVGRPDPAAPRLRRLAGHGARAGRTAGGGVLHAPLGRRCRQSAVRCRPADSAGTVRAREDGTGRSRGRPPVRGGTAGDVRDRAPPHPSRLPRSDRWRSPPA